MIRTCGCVPRRDAKGQTPLFLAVKAGSISIAATLLEVGAKINIKSNTAAGGQSLLHVAVEQRLSNTDRTIDWLNMMALLLQSVSEPP